MNAVTLPSGKALKMYCAILVVLVKPVKSANGKS